MLKQLKEKQMISRQDKPRKTLPKKGKHNELEVQSEIQTWDFVHTC